jgi:hypothetical protein
MKSIKADKFFILLDYRVNIKSYSCLYRRNFKEKVLEIFFAGRNFERETI